MPTFVWFGSLATVPPRAVIERCRALAVSARAELRSGERRARIDIVGGDVAGVEGADPKIVAGWTDGSFRVTQSLPDFNGDLTMDRDLKGTLAERGVKTLLAWAEEHRLTIKFDLYHEAERAHLEVQNGRVAEVVVDGKSDLAALARVEVWRQGEWRAALKPLFIEETAPVFIPEGDMTPTPMPVISASGNENPPWLALKEDAPPADSMAWLTPARSVPAISEQPATAAEEEPPTEADAPATLPEFPPEHLWEPTFGSQPVKVPDAAREEPTFGPMGEAFSPTIPATPALSATVPDLPTQNVRMPPPRKGLVAAGVIAGVALLAGGGALAVYIFHKPQPIAQPVPPALPDAAVAQVEPPRPKRKPERDRPVPSRAELRDRAKRLIDKARREIIEGKKKSAIALLEEARRLEPDNVSVRVYLAQAKGKLGEGMLVVESKPKGAKVVVDGAEIGQTPIKLKAVPAGEHTVQVGDRSEDVEIVKDKKKRMNFNLRERVARGKKGG